MNKFSFRKPANKFWRNSEQPFHTVTHREVGDIPGILKAYDIHSSITQEEMQVHTGARADQLCKMLNDWQNGVIGFREWTNHPFHSGDVKVSVIKNPYPGKKKIKDYRGEEYEPLS